MAELLKNSINSDGTPYNGGAGYKFGYRLNSSGVETAQAISSCTGFMPVSVGDTITVTNVTLPNTDAIANCGVCYICLYDSSFKLISAHYSYIWYTNFNDSISPVTSDSSRSITQFTVNETAKTSGVAYMRMSSFKMDDTSSVKNGAEEADANVIARAEITLADVQDGEQGPQGESGKDGQMLYASCSTEADNADKVATLSGGAISLAAGTTVSVKFDHANTAPSPTLNVNSTGAKPIRCNGAAYAYWDAGMAVTFVYDGTYWQVCSAAIYGATSTIGNPSTGNVYTDGTSISMRNGEDVLAHFAASSITLGLSTIEEDNGKMYFNAPSGSYFRSLYKGASASDKINHQAGLSVISDENLTPQAIMSAHYNEAVVHTAATIACFAYGDGGHISISKGIYGGTVKSGELDDWVVFEGSVNDWYVRKFAGGRAEVFGWKSQYVSGSTDNWHWMSASEQFGGWAWPFEWAESGPLAHIRAETSSGNVWLTYGPSSTTNAPCCYAVSSQAFAETIGICIYAHGRWK